MANDPQASRPIRSKSDELHPLDVELLRSFGEGLPTVEGERLAENHVVYKVGTESEIEFSVIAPCSGQAQGTYSVQIEVDVDQPDFDIPYAGDELSLEAVLKLFGQFIEGA